MVDTFKIVTVLFTGQEAKIEKVQELAQWTEPGSTHAQAFWLQGPNFVLKNFHITRK